MHRWDCIFFCSVSVWVLYISQKKSTFIKWFIIITGASTLRETLLRLLLLFIIFGPLALFSIVTLPFSPHLFWQHRRHIFLSLPILAYWPLCNSLYFLFQMRLKSPEILNLVCDHESLMKTLLRINWLFVLKLISVI